MSAPIPDPADHEPDWYAAIARRYQTAPVIALDGDTYAQAFGNVCDLMVQMLWAESYGTDPSDEDMHTSDAARGLALAVFTAAGIVESGE